MNPRVDTKSKILDSAEKLFGKNGFEATSLRDITTAAQVNLAAINYHFQTKESLIDAVIARRIEPMNVRRIEILDRLGASATLEDVLRAFLLPFVELDLDEVAPLMGRVHSDPNQFVEKVFRKHLSGMAQRFQGELARLLPHLTPAERAWRWNFSIGALTHIMSWSQILPALTGGLCDLTDRQAVLDYAVSFLAGGFRAPSRQPVVQLKGNG